MTEDWLVSGDRSEAARDRLYAIATEMIGRHGVDRFELNELARRAHCSRATVYRHVGGKARLLESVWALSSAGVVAEVEKAVDGLAGPRRAEVAITVALREIRSDRVIRQFVRSRHALTAEAADTVIGSATINRIAADLMGLDPTEVTTIRFAIRTFLAMLLFPPKDPKEESELIEIFVRAIHQAA